MRMMMITITLMVFYDVCIFGSTFITGIVHVFCIYAKCIAMKSDRKCAIIQFIFV